MITLSRHDVYMLAGGLQIAAQQCTDRDGRLNPAGEHQADAAGLWWRLHAEMADDDRVECIVANESTRDYATNTIELDEPDEDEAPIQDSAPVEGA